MHTLVRSDGKSVEEKLDFLSRNFSEWLWHFLIKDKSENASALAENGRIRSPFLQT